MRKIIISVIIIFSVLLSPNLLQADRKKASNFSTPIKKRYSADFFTEWRPDKQVFTYYGQSMYLSSEMIPPKEMLYINEFIDVHKAAMEIYNKYLNTEYTIKTSSTFYYFVLKNSFGSKLKLYEWKTRRLLFIYSKDESSIIYRSLKGIIRGREKRRKTVNKKPYKSSCE